MHKFVSSREARFCFVCQSHWTGSNTSGSLLSDHHACTKCGVTVHSSCRTVAKSLSSAFPCSSECAQTLKLSGFTCSGRLTVTMMHVYDLPVDKGSSVFGVMSALGSVAKTEDCLYGSEDCIFRQKRQLVIELNDSPVVGSELTVELWSAITIVNFLDNLIAGCTLSLTPPLLYPHAILERWFTMTSGSEGTAAGMVLLQMHFTPRKAEDSSMKHPLIPIVEMQRLLNIGEVNEVTQIRREPSVDVMSMVRGEKCVQLLLDPPMNLDPFSDLSAHGSTTKTLPLKTAIVPVEAPVIRSKNPSPSKIDLLIPSASERIEANIAPLKMSELTRPIDLSTFTTWAKQSLGLIEKVAEKVSIEKTPPSGVGFVLINLRSAYKLNPVDTADGDYLVTVAMTDTDQELSTGIVLNTASPHFDTTFTLSAPHYRSRLVLTLVDSRGDKKIGRTSLSVFALMQRQQANSALGIWSQSMSEESFIRPDDYTLYDLGGKSPVGHVSASVIFKEDVEGLFFSATPRPVLPVPPDQVSVDRLREHIGRLGALFRIYRVFCNEYKKIMQWEVLLPVTSSNMSYVHTLTQRMQEPLISSSVLLLFVFSCLRLDAEFFLVVPTFSLVCVLVVLYLRRKSGAFSKQYIQIANNDASQIHRPIAILRIALCGFRHVQPAQTPALIKLSLQTGTEEDKAEYSIATVQLTGKGGQVLPSSAEIAQSLSAIMHNLSIIKNENRRDAILQNACDPWGADISYLYPVLQQIDKTTNSDGELVLLPWDAHDGIINIAVHTAGSYSLSSLMEKEPTIGSIKIPLRDLVNSTADSNVEREIDAWFPIQWGNADAIESSVEELLSGVVFGRERRMAPKAQAPEVRLRLQLDLRRTAGKPSAGERDLSAAVHEILTTSSGGSTFSALWHMRTNVQYVQNLIGGVIDSAESFKNVFTWAQPDRTAILFVLALLGWVVTQTVPSRYLILGAGLYEFSAVFPSQSKESAWGTRINNLLESVPNDVDMRDVYAGERRKFQEHEQGDRKQQLNNLLLRLAGDCRWKGAVRIRAKVDWMDAFLVFQGRRLLWFAREDDVSEGREFEGQLLLIGYAGTSDASPLEIREVGEPSRLLSVFGKDQLGVPLKKTISCSSKTERDILRDLIEDVVLVYS